MDRKAKRKALLTKAREDFPVGTSVQFQYGYSYTTYTGEVVKHKIGENRESLNGVSLWRGDKAQVQVAFHKGDLVKWFDLCHLEKT